MARRYPLAAPPRASGDAMSGAGERHEPVTLEQWLTKERARLDRFAAMWRKGEADKPDEFPAQMMPGDWDDQYFGFIDEDLTP